MVAFMYGSKDPVSGRKAATVYIYIPKLYNFH